MGFWDTLKGIGNEGYETFGNPLGLLALLSTSLNVGSNLYAGRQADSSYNKWLKQAQAPVDPNQYYNPMTDIERQEMLRTLRGELAVRGVPLDSMIASDVTSRGLATNQRQRWMDAMQIAMKQREGVLGARSGSSQRTMQTMGDPNAIGNFLGLQQMRRDRAGMRADAQSQQRMFLDALRNVYGGNAPTKVGATPEGNVPSYEDQRPDEEEYYGNS